MTYSRRHFLKDSASLVTASWLVSEGFLEGTAKANTSSPFVLSIHAGSFDGFSSGLLQPERAGAFPIGAFERNIRRAAANPFLNEHIQANGHIFHHYNRVLRHLSDNLIHVTCVPGSLDHNVARLIQKSGASALGAAHWVLGAGHQIGLGINPSTPAIVVSDNMECLMSGSAPHAVGILSRNLGSLRSALEKPASIKENPPASSHSAILEAVEKSFKAQGRASAFGDATHASMLKSIGTSLFGLPQVADDNPLVIAAKQAINRDTLINLISTECGRNPETTAILADNGNLNQVADKFQLAAILASTGMSPAMAISMPVEDRHSGGSQVVTARLSAIMWSGLALFWKFIKDNSLDKTTLVIATHEFSRSPWNARVQNFTVNHKGTNVTVAARGTDHHPVNGVYLLSGAFPTSGRLGGVISGYIAGGGKDIGSPATGTIAAPTTLGVTGSALMGVFPSIFRHPGQPESGRVIRGLWPAFQDDSIIQAIANG